MSEAQPASAAATRGAEDVPERGATDTSLDTIMLGAPRTAREAIQRAGIPLETLRRLSSVNDRRSALDVGAGVAWFFSVPLLYYFLPSPITLVACVLLAIHNFNYIAQLVHESDHATLFRNRTVNDIVGNLCALLLCYHRKGHWQSHLFHHLHLNTDRDPDQVWSRPGENGRRILFKLLEDLFFVSAFKRFLQYFQPDDRANYEARPWTTITAASLFESASKLLPIGVVQGLVFAVYAFAAGPLYYLWLHLLPLTMIYPVMIRIRSVAEHGFPGDLESPADTWMTRSNYVNFLERFVIAPMGQNYHYEHHLFPGMPNSSLPAVQLLLVEAGIRIPCHSSYVAFIAIKIWKDLRR